MTIGKQNRSTAVSILKSVFLVILNVPLGTVFEETVTNEHIAEGIKEDANPAYELTKEDNNPGYEILGIDDTQRNTDDLYY